jgi:hypothetical protein
LETALRCLKAVAGKANWVYYPVVFLVDEPIDGFIAKRSFLANPRTAAHCFFAPVRDGTRFALRIGLSASH